METGGEIDSLHRSEKVLFVEDHHDPERYFLQRLLEVRDTCPNMMKTWRTYESTNEATRMCFLSNLLVKYFFKWKVRGRTHPNSRLKFEDFLIYDITTT